MIDYDNLILLFSFLFLVLLTVQLNKIYSYSDPMIERIKMDLLKVDSRVANLKFYASNESFTEDKKFVYLCLKDSDGNYYDYNMLMYVSLHELAHAFSQGIDTSHSSKEFKDNFRSLLKRGEEVGLYDPKKPLNYDYCPRT